MNADKRKRQRAKKKKHNSLMETHRKHKISKIKKLIKARKDIVAR